MLGKNVFHFVFAAALVLALSNVREACAQGRGMFGQQGINPLAAVGFEPVQKELGLKSDQAEKVKDLVDGYREEFMQEMQGSGIDFQALRDAPADEREKKMAQIAEISKKISDKYQPKLNEVLDQSQKTRLHEIAIQVAGAGALQDTGVMKKLGLTQEQKDKLASIRKGFAARQREVFAGGGDQAERFAKMRELREEQTAKATEVLTKDQQGQFTKMKGKSFDVAQLRQRRPAQ
jgi:hypothetical protein